MRIIKSFFLCIIILNCIYNIASADSVSFDWPLPLDAAHPVTTPYGWVQDGIHNGRLHDGIDLGCEYYEPVKAIGDGQVIRAGWNDGYGFYVEIYHGDFTAEDGSTGPLDSFYGHNNSLNVYPGQQVTKGDVIAYGGSTGNSTGPHVHLGMSFNGKTTNPNWWITGSPVSGYNENQSDAFEPFDFKAFFDIAYPFRDMIEKFANACRDGLGKIQEMIKDLFLVLAAIDVAWVAMFGALMEGGELGKEGIMKWLVGKAVTWSIILFFINHWGDVAVNNIRDFFTSSGAIFYGSDMNAAGAVLSDPSSIVQKGILLTKPFFEFVTQFHNPISLYLNLTPAIMAMLMGVIIIILWVLMGIQIMLAYISFYIAGLFSIISCSLSGLKYTRNWPAATNGINTLITTGMILCWWCFFSLLVTNIMATMQVPNPYNIEEKSKIERVVDGLSQADENKMISWKYYKTKGLPDVSVAVITGAQQQESSFNPKAGSSTYPGPYGLDQWYQGRLGTPGSGDGLYGFAERQNGDISDIYVQLDYSWWELENLYPDVLQKLQNAQGEGDLYELAAYYDQYYEKSGGAELNERIEYAQDALKNHGGILPTKTFNFVKAFEIFFVTVIMVVVGNKITGVIKIAFGAGNGWHW